MGITQKSMDRLNPFLKPNSNILIIGCQNLYDNDHYMEVAQDYFRSIGHTVKSIDVYACNGADVMDLREDLKFEPIYDLVLQHGTVEHVDGGLYQPFKNMHEACKVDGVMIHENPKTDNWPGHGQHYFTKDFYLYFARACNYDLNEVTEEPAMGNVTDGWNVCAVMIKKEPEFIFEKVFNDIYKQFIFPQ